MKKYLLIYITAILISGCTSSNRAKVYSEKDIAIIPKPEMLQLKKGVFQFNKNTQFVITNPNQKEIVHLIIDKLNTVANWDLKVTNKMPQVNYVVLTIDKNLKKEAYELRATKNHISIKASSHSGFLYAIETLRQLLPTAVESKTKITNVGWEIPNVEIKDKPRFKWRGLMLDLSRHFFGKKYIKEVIDGLAMLKMNVLHLHLVDDQGWRIEIKKYPKLTQVGAWRVNQENLHWNSRKPVKPGDKGTYGGFLSQEDLKDIVAYAQSKDVEIIPEIEMPAHVSSAIASYPYLSCNEHKIGVPSGGVWPITDIYCAGKEGTFQFLENVLTEVMEIFPSKYIHIGGDEATKTNWKKCPYCKRRMITEKLHNVEELQSYFIRRIEKFINAHGKKLIGWDEILEGGLAPEATVMSWRGVKGGLAAAAQGHDVVMTPGTYCYFDHYQGPQNEEPLAIGGYLPLNKVYQFDPVVDSMTREEAKYVLGGQANLWSEYISTESHSQYMIYPRLAALAETVWSPKASRNWNDFSTRIQTLFERYKYLGIHYAKSSYLIRPKIEPNLKEKSVILSLQNEYPNSDIRFVLNGNNNLDETSHKYTHPIALTETTTIKASLFKDNKPVGKVFYDTIRFHKAVARKVNYLNPYNDRYQGAGAFNMVNTLRGTKNFHDGQWQAWLNEDMNVVIDLENDEIIKQVTVGSMENQGPGIYFPTQVKVSVSIDGKNYKEVGFLKRDFKQNDKRELKDFKITFAKQKVRFVKVEAKCLKRNPNGGGAWLFVDEILVD